MNTKTFLCISASLLLVACGSRTRDIPKNEYVELIKQAQELSASADKWNTKCGDHPPFSNDCQEERQVLSNLWGAYILRAVKYKDEGNDHNAIMRAKIINFNTQIALFNVKCAGQAHTEIQELQCAGESDFIEQERADLAEQIWIDTGKNQPKTD
jgi:hypothetical protein